MRPTVGATARRSGSKDDDGRLPSSETRLIALPEPNLEDLLATLGDRETAADHLLPDTGIGIEWERLLSAPFIIDERYGTRCSTVVRIDRDRLLQLRERRFDRGGRITGEDAFEFRGVNETPL